MTTPTFPPNMSSTTPTYVLNGQVLPEPANLTAQRLADQNTLPPASILSTDAAVYQRGLANGGVTITLPGPLVVLASTSSDGRTDLNGLYTMAKEDSTFSSIWVQSTGAITLSSAQIILIGGAVLKFYQETFTALANVQQLITTGQLLTIAAVRASSLWPSPTIDLSNTNTSTTSATPSSS